MKRFVYFCFWYCWLARPKKDMDSNDFAQAAPPNLDPQRNLAENRRIPASAAAVVTGNTAFAFDQRAIEIQRG